MTDIRNTDELAFARYIRASEPIHQNLADLQGFWSGLFGILRDDLHFNSGQLGTFLWLQVESAAMHYQLGQLAQQFGRDHPYQDWKPEDRNTRLNEFQNAVARVV